MTTDDDAALTAEEREELELALALSASSSSSDSTPESRGRARVVRVYESTSTLLTLVGRRREQEGSRRRGLRSWCSARLSESSGRRASWLVVSSVVSRRDDHTARATACASLPRSLY